MQTIQYLKYFRYSPRYVAEFIDDWYAAIYGPTHNDLADRCESVGFESRSPSFGMDYDTSQRLELAIDEKQKQLSGEGDLRYLLRKSPLKQQTTICYAKTKKARITCVAKSVTLLIKSLFSNSRT